MNTTSSRIALVGGALVLLFCVGCASDHRRGGTVFPVGIYAAHLQSGHSGELGGVRSLVEHAAEGGVWEGQHYGAHFAPDRGQGWRAIWGGALGLFNSREDRVHLGAYRFHFK